MHRENVPCWGKNLDTGKIKEWDSLGEATRDMGGSSHDLTLAIKGYGYFHGWAVAYKDKPLPNITGPAKRGGCKGKRSSWPDGAGKKLDYTVWNNYTDELVAFGTADQCTKAMGLTRTNGFYEMITNVRKGINKKYTVTAVIADKEQNNVCCNDGMAHGR